MNYRKNFNFTALKLCGIFGAIYFLQVYYGVKLGFNPSTSPAWKFFSSIFAHSDLEHLFNNIFFIGLFGSIYERLTGSRVFILTFLVSAIFANLSAFIFFPESFIIGASGGGMGLMAALAVYRPNQPGLALGIPAPMWAALVVYVAINLAGLTGSTGTAYEAHLLGMLSGTVVGLSLRDGDEASDEDELDDFENFRERIREWEEKWMM